ncbi:bifunctional hydroxymethylpyrimidine kinase/phosphomethylpyrimidine kinase [Acidipila rosea]|uniref:hydroxymethylpyrimidine kinase n=1 Tax=Acidipila rosea TaxID=768535 RepID=A0A4R1LC45_9BACT|nr:bifunctional hydroxymethylpyrimidine kinase/phosphomethylpyrimidine kinase [Acidipila rosea]TCK75754.1 hydroxymethylpyrimidine/phosphomethylpyrimidine kinase [Acidipila rosea]
MSATTAATKIALAIAGFDPSAGAGIAADLKVFAAHGVYGMACITGLTVQSTRGVRRVEPSSAEIMRETLDWLSEDVTFAGVKIGMLANAANVRETVAFLMKGPPRDHVVLDPVIRSSSGRPLLDPAGVTAMRDTLLKHLGWITPNIEELAILAGVEYASRESVPEVAGKLAAHAARLGNRRLNIIVTGGHLEPPHDFLRLASGEEHWLPGERVHTRATHGTGCAYSSALLSRLLLGDAPLEAAAAAKNYVIGALRAAPQIGRGHGPMNHFWMKP